jgi:hypothetical protein
MGKSTMAAGLYHHMKGMGMHTELILEPARRRVYANLPLYGAGQLSITTELYEYIGDVLRADVPIIIVDTHILSPLLYTRDSIAINLAISLSKELEDQCKCITLLMVGDEPPYTGEGRSTKDRPSLEGIGVHDALAYVRRYRVVDYRTPPGEVLTLLDGLI